MCINDKSVLTVFQNFKEFFTRTFDEKTRSVNNYYLFSWFSDQGCVPIIIDFYSCGKEGRRRSIEDKESVNMHQSKSSRSHEEKRKNVLIITCQ